MGMNKYDQSDAWIKRRTHMVFDDFDVLVSTDVWTTTVSNVTIAGQDLEGGQVLFTGTTNANDYGYLATTKKTFKIVANNPIGIECLIQWTQANTNQMAMMFGVSSAVGAGMIANTTGEPIGTFDGAVIYTIPGSTFYKTKSSVGTTSPGASISSTVAGQTAWQRLLIVIEPVSSTIAEVTYWVNGVQLYVANQITPIKDQLTYTSAGVMQFFLGMKQISTANAEALLVDYMTASQLRILFTP